MRMNQIALGLFALGVACNNLRLNKGIVMGQPSLIASRSGNYYPYLNQGYSMFYYTNIPGILPKIPTIPAIESINETIPSLPSAPSIQSVPNNIPTIPSFSTIQQPMTYPIPQMLSLPISNSLVISPPIDNGSNANTNMINNAIASSTMI